MIRRSSLGYYTIYTLLLLFRKMLNHDDGLFILLLRRAFLFLSAMLLEPDSIEGRLRSENVRLHKVLLLIQAYHWNVR